MELSIIGSGKCNLHCSYCFLCKTKKTTQILDEDIVNGLKDHTYLQRALTALNWYDHKPEDVGKLSFWGGEPTINLPVWTEHISEWMKALPRLVDLNFITNATFPPQNMIEFIKTVDANAMHRMNVILQVSLDGPDPYTLKGRGIPAQKITDNLKEFIKQFNQLYLTNTDLIVFFKSTLQIDDFIEALGNIENATKYYTWWQSLIHDLEYLSISKNIKGFFADAVNYAYMEDYTQQQGIGYAHTTDIFYAIDWQKLDLLYPTTFSLRDGMDPFDVVKNANGATIEESMCCSSYDSEIIVKPDGTVVGCMVGLYNDIPSYARELKEVDNSEYLRNKSIPQNFYYNYNTEPERSEKFKKYYTYYKNNHGITDFSIGLAILYELGEANQIAYYYKDNPDLIYEHFHLLSEKTKCFFNSLKETGCPYVLLPGVYRLYFNGFLDKAIKRIRYEKMEKLKKNNYAYE